MSRRRGGGSGGGVAVPSLGAVQWRQREELAGLTAALRLLPTAAAPPVRLLRAVQRVLLCVEHILYGVPLNGDGDDDDDDWWGLYGARRGEDDGLGSAGAEALAAMEGSGPGACAAFRERTAADMAAVLIREVLQPVADGGTAGPYRTGGGGSGNWDSQLYSAALLHHLLALSSDLMLLAAPGDGSTAAVRAGQQFPGAGREGPGDAAVWDGAVSDASLPTAPDALLGTGGGSSWVVYRDPLASSSRQWLPAGVYLKVVLAMGWEELMLDLLAWVPEPAVAAAIVQQALRRCPGLAPGLAAALMAAATGGRSGVMRRVSGAAVAAAAGPCRPLELARRLAGSAPVLVTVAKAVQGAAAAAAVQTGPVSADGAASNGSVSKWLPCLLLLGRSLEDMLRGWSAAAGSGSAAEREGTRTEASVAAAVPAATERKNNGGGGGTFTILHCAETYCEALQEGLCAWQEGIVAAAAESVAAVSPRAAGGAGGAGGAGRDVEAAAANAEALLRLAQEDLLRLLDEQARAHVAAQSAPAEGRQQQKQHQLLPLLPHAAIIRLRGRIALLARQAATGGDGVTSILTPVAAAAVPPPAGVPQRLMKEDGIWSAFPSTATAAAAAERPLPSWLRAAAVSVSSAVSAAAPGSRLRGALCGVPWPMGPGTGTAPAGPGPGTAPAGSKAAAVASARGCGGFDLGGGFGVAKAQERLSARLRMVQGARERTVAVAVALLTPGMASWLAVQRDERVAAAAGADPYSPFRVALALLEMLQGAIVDGGGGGPPSAAAVVPSAASAVPEAAAAAGSAREPGVEGARARSGSGCLATLRMEEGAASAAAASADTATADVAGARVWEQQFELSVLRLVAECLACVAAAEQQGALQAVVGKGPAFARLRARLAADNALQTAASRALVTLSNRTAAVEESSDGLILSAAQEAQRLAAAARSLLPYAVLTPSACVRRLVLDGLAHPGQQPWVLQLLRCFAVAEPPQQPLPRSYSGGGCSSSSVLVACLRRILGDAELSPRTPADLRSLVGLLDGLVRGGVVLPRELLGQLVTPSLEDVEAEAEAGARCEIGPSVLKALSALQAAQHLLNPALPLLYSPATELAAAQPSRLLLAVARLLERLYGMYDKGCQLEAAAIDAAATVMERCVDLYGSHLAASRTAGSYGVAEAGDLHVLAAGSEGLPRRLLAVLVPLLEIPAAPATLPAERHGDRDGTGGGGEYINNDDDDGGGCSRALAAHLTPAALWRPRTLRAAGPLVAREVVYDTLTFAASSAAHAMTLRQALLAAADEAEREEEELGWEDADRGLSADASERVAARLWADWGAEPAVRKETSSRPGGGAAEAGAGAGLTSGAVARHAAATAARGLLQLPTPRLLEGLVSALAALLPTTSPEQAKRVLLAALPALVRMAHGGNAVSVVRWLQSSVSGRQAAGARAAAPAKVVAGRAPAGAAKAPGPTPAGAPAHHVDRDAVYDVVAWGLESLTRSSPSPAFHCTGPSAADVAVAMVFAGRGAAEALSQAAAGGTTSDPVDAPGGGGGAVDGMEGATASVEPVRQQRQPLAKRRALLTAVADRCAAHLALLAARLGPAEVAAATAAANGERETDVEVRRVATVALVLLAELCGVAAGAAAAAAAAATATEDVEAQQSRTLDMWQAVILSVLQQLVSTLAVEAYGSAIPEPPTPSFGTIVRVAEPPPPPLQPPLVPTPTSSNFTANPTAHHARVRTVLRCVRCVLRVLPGMAANATWAAVQRLCEDKAEEGTGSSGSRAPGADLMAAVQDVDME